MHASTVGEPQRHAEDEVAVLLDEFVLEGGDLVLLAGPDAIDFVEGDCEDFPVAVPEAEQRVDVSGGAVARRVGFVEGQVEVGSPSE